MEGYDAWITGRKGFQSATRATLPLFEAEGDRIKINPLVGWGAKDVLDYIAEAGPAAPSARRQGLSLDRLPALHERGQARRGRARRPLARAGQDRMRHSSRRARRGSGHLMALWRRGGFAEDSWTFLADDAPVPADGAIVVSLKRWLAEREALGGAGRAGRRRGRRGRRRAGASRRPRGPPAGRARLRQVRRRPRASPTRACCAIAIGFKGELRAIGDVLIDEIPLMLRCGFDSFEVTNPPTLSALRAGRLPGPPIHYQPGSGGGEAPAGSRPWLRTSRAA